MEDECLESGADERQFEFVKDYILTKNIDGTNYQRERRILAFGNGDEQMHKGIENLVS